MDELAQHLRKFFIENGKSSIVTNIREIRKDLIKSLNLQLIWQFIVIILAFYNLIKNKSNQTKEKLNKHPKDLYSRPKASEYIKREFERR